MLNDPFLTAQVRLFSAIADPIRLRILRLLHQKGAMPVTKIYESLAKPQNLISHHLNCLKTCGLVRVEKRGRMAIHQTADPEIATILDWAEQWVIRQAEGILSCRVVAPRGDNPPEEA